MPVTSSMALLGPGEYAVLVRDGAAFQAAFPGTAFIEPPSWPELNNGGDAVILYHGEAAVDSIVYVPGWGGAKRSLERRDPAGPSDAAANWGTSQAPAGATPGLQNSLYAPDRSPPVLRFAEQVESLQVDAVFDEALDPASVAPDRFRLGGLAPATATLLEEATGVRLTFEALPEAALLVAEHLRDRAGNELSRGEAPVAWRPEPGDLVLNELMYDPLQDPYDHRPDQPEYVEIYNRTARQLSLRGLALAEAVDEEGRFFRQPLLDSLIALPADGYLVIYDCGTCATAPAVHDRLADSFPEIDVATPGMILLPVGTVTSRGLRQEGEAVRLLRRDSLELDRVDYVPAWHNLTVLAATSARGTALERISPEAPSNDPTNWTSSTASSGGTPGRPNTAFVRPGDPPAEPGLTAAPSPFYPEGMGEERVAVLTYRLRSAAALVRARIYDAHGRPVRRLEEAALTGPSGQLRWDGRDDEGRRLRIGVYVVLLEAVAAGEGITEAYKTAVVLARPLD